jgi:hypothetical protein
MYQQRRLQQRRAAFLQQLHVSSRPLAVSVTVLSLLALNIVRLTRGHEMQMNDAKGSRKARKLRGKAATSCSARTALGGILTIYRQELT